MPNSLKNKLEILAFRVGTNGPVKSFKSIKEAAEYFKVHRDTIVRRILDGELFDDSFFLDWGLNIPSELIKSIEESYTKRFKDNSHYSLEFYYNHASQKEMQNTRL